MTSDPIREQVQAALGSAYTLERELGGGGMSRVFVATETALRRRVVVKVLSAELAEGLSAERFAREIEMAANLQDPHIVPVLNTGTAGKLPWFTMPYVEGESLRARLMRGTVPYQEAIGILRDVAMALECAHARGVVHRDIKPDNVLLAGRTAVVADFGIAKAVSAARTGGAGASSATLTSVGQSLGTPAYMAPEQATGDPIDHRVDLYAWGVMAYELLAGRHPFSDKSTTQQLIAAHIAERPKPLGSVKPGLAPPLSAFVMRCLEKSPGDRPSSAGAILEALDGMSTPGTSGVRLEPGVTTSRRPLVIGAIVLLVAAGAFGAMQFARRNGETASASTAADTRRIAVLPFENLGDSADAYFVTGMTDAMRSKLTGLAELEVIARASSTPYAGTTKPPKQVADELGVRYLLTGTVRFDKRAGAAARVQVSPALVEIGSDGSAANRWAEPFDADLADVFKVQGEIAGKVVNAMRVALGGAAQAQLAEAPTANAAAYDLYLRGEAAWNAGSRTDPASSSRAIPLYEQSVSLDPAFAAAWAALSRARTSLFFNSRRTDQALAARSLEAANKALSLKPNDAIGLVALAAHRRLVQSDPAAAQTLLDRARQLAPNNALILNDLAATQSDLALFENAARSLELATQLDPRTVRTWVLRSRVALRRGDLESAPVLRDRLAALAPGDLSSLLNRVCLSVAMGDLARGQAEVVSASRETPIERLVAYLAQYQDLGWVLTPDQEQILLSLGPDAFDGDRASWAIVRAQQYSWRGDSARARIWSDSAARSYETQLRGTSDDPQLRVFRGLALALSGRPREAIRTAREAVEGQPASVEFSNITAYVYYVAARVAIASGDRVQALTWLAESRRRRYIASPAWIRLDPSFKPLLGDPQFEQVLAARY